MVMSERHRHLLATLEALEVAFNLHANECTFDELRYIHDRLTALLIECEEALARADLPTLQLPAQPDGPR
jgi:hypothetical protein